MEIIDINNGGGDFIHDLVHSDTDWRDKAEGYVLWTTGQAVAQGQGQKDISGCQSCFISGSGGLPEQEKRSHLLTIPWESHV